MKIIRNEIEKMDFTDVSDGTKLAAVHPGEVLLRDFMEPLEVTQHRLAITIRVPPRRINEIVHHKRSITTDTALRLATFFGTSPDFWTSLQASYDTEHVRNRIIEVLKAIPRYEPKLKHGQRRMAA
ncbi:MAG: HigA family addiction module antitoxin [Desulfuromonadaceae bacterium]|nr:HigA family addiction module antitoxin [Desulfuromonadaceae bacterium]MDD5106945.1 HigA family addiction module antitoxin [Desulfuromonadaceae bacterium]